MEERRLRARSDYGRVTDDFVSLLVDVVGDKNVLRGDELENYARDEMLRAKPFIPEVVVKPDNSSSVAGILKLANQRVIPVTPRGGGTGLCGGATPIYGGVVLSLERMNRIIEIDRDNFVATVEAGLPRRMISLYSQAAPYQHQRMPDKAYGYMIQVPVR